MRICWAVQSHKLAAILVATLASIASSESIAVADDIKTAPTAQSVEPATGVQIGTGINWFSLPSWAPRGPDFLGTGDSRVIDDGIGFGISLDLPLGQIGSQPLFLEWNGGIADLSSSSTDRTSLAGQNSLNFSLGNSANGRIDPSLLTASPIGTLPATATADVTFTDSASATGHTFLSDSSPAGGRVTHFASQTGVTGGSFAATLTNGSTQSAAAYAAYGDNTGFTLAATGDLSSSAFIDKRSEDAFVIDQELLLGAPIDLQGGWTVTPKFGPMYRSIDRDVDFRRTLRITANQPGIVVPEVGFTQTDELDARYVGAIAELAVTQALQPDLSVSFDARLGGAYLHSRYRSHYSAILPTMTTGPFDFISETRDDASLLAGLGAGLRYAPKENVVIGLDTGVNFVNKVPTIDYVADAGGGVSPTIGMSHAIDYNVSVNVTWRF
ncbi:MULTISPECIES: hypothetical protein [unclassified Rhizobium]|uniref:hypothetical protein n=1 Tax=unclassified Rhizobium TaxID=2613769 RepID=UPI0016129967|nr:MULTISPECIES: hypothetical protein [unclassified Rhizobium]MBB3542259.1 hypothetical protein [Rhizobium sp. BK399]MCS3738118.1 hypothetical protein [Rhizobium sp. BK661]MCS4092966.1 hypothetical protein [Rhizobium sp. BK176]